MPLEFVLFITCMQLSQFVNEKCYVRNDREIDKLYYTKVFTFFIPTVEHCNHSIN